MNLVSFQGRERVMRVDGGYIMFLLREEQRVLCGRKQSRNALRWFMKSINQSVWLFNVVVMVYEIEMELTIGLITDPHRGLMLTTWSFRRVVEFLIGLGGPILMLGGGGYHPPSAAKHFALLTGVILGRELEDNIPVEAEYWEELE